MFGFLRFVMDAFPTLTDRLGRALRSIAKNQAGVSVVEFALSLPMVVALGMFGIEVANMASTRMQISQIALAVADNASRLGQTDNSGGAPPMVDESDIAAVMFGALQQGSALDFESRGRVVLSSFERRDGATEPWDEDDDVDADDDNFIHWQRCAGDLDRDSRYGDAGDVLASGIGKEGLTVTSHSQAVMFAEVFYEYQPIFAGMLLDGLTFRQEAALIVRDDRTLTGLTGTASPSSTCAAPST